MGMLEEKNTMGTRKERRLTRASPWSWKASSLLPFLLFPLLFFSFNLLGLHQKKILKKKNYGPKERLEKIRKKKC